MKNKTQNNKIIIYQGDNGVPNIEVRIEDETVWLSQQQISDLFQTTRENITMHIKNIYNDGELDKNSTCKDFLRVQKEGVREITRNINHYNLDMIISLGYRVDSKTATAFRQWATQRLREYIVKGFTMDDERLKGSGGGSYWKELLDRIRDIRSSEKMLYRQVLDLYATSIDYNPKSEESMIFFKTVQNKLHYATNQKTAAELIYSRADANHDFMGMTTFAGAMPIRSEAFIAKNYLTQDELFRLNRLVSAFFDLAEIKAQEHEPMHMKDWIVELDKFAGAYGKGVLKNAGGVSHKKALEKAEKEYRKYQVKTLSPVEVAYLDTIKGVQKIAEQKAKEIKKMKGKK